MAQRTTEPRILRSSSRAPRNAPAEAGQHDLAQDARGAPPPVTAKNAPDLDSGIRNEDLLTSVITTMQEQQRLLTFLFAQQRLAAQTHAIPQPPAQPAQLSPLAM